MSDYRRIALRRTGGLAAMRPVAVEVDLTAEDPEAARLLELLADVDVEGLARERIPEQPRPEGYSYELTLDRAGAQHRIVRGEGAIPPELRPVIKALERRWLDMQRARRRS